MGWCSLRGHRNGLAAGTVGCRADGMGLGLVRVAVKKEASWPSVCRSSLSSLWFWRSPSPPSTDTHVHTHPRSHGS